MCSTRSSGISRGKPIIWETASTVAHEIGHSLGKDLFFQLYGKLLIVAHEMGNM